MSKVREEKNNEIENLRVGERQIQLEIKKKKKRDRDTEKELT